MADNQFSVDTERLAQASPAVESLAERIRSIGTNLQGRLSALGDCWGDDNNGEQFLKQYSDPKSQLLEGISSTAEVLDSTVDGIQTMAKGFQRTEDQNIEALRGVTSGSSDGQSQTPATYRKTMAPLQQPLAPEESGQLLPRIEARAQAVPAERLQAREPAVAGERLEDTMPQPTLRERALTEPAQPAATPLTPTYEEVRQPLPPARSSGLTEPQQLTETTQPADPRLLSHVDPLQPSRRQINPGEPTEPEQPAEPRHLDRLQPTHHHTHPGEPTKPEQPAEPHHLNHLQPTHHHTKHSTPPTEPEQPAERHRRLAEPAQPLLPTTLRRRVAVEEDPDTA